MLKGISPSIEVYKPLEEWVPNDLLIQLKNLNTKTPFPYIQTLLPFELKIR
jgi:hypothetical protein